MPPTKDPNQRWKVSVPLPRDEDLPADLVRELSQNPPLNVARMFAGTLDMAPGVMALVRAVFYAENVDVRLRQLIILRVAQLLDCAYEWQANVVFAKNVGLTDEQIARVGVDDPVQGLGPEEDLICQATDEITKDGAVSDSSLAALLERFGPTVTNKYILMMSWFNLLSRYLLSTRVPLEVTNKIEGRTAPI